MYSRLYLVPESTPDSLYFSDDIPNVTQPEQFDFINVLPMCSLWLHVDSHETSAMSLHFLDQIMAWFHSSFSDAHTYKHSV